MCGEPDAFPAAHFDAWAEDYDRDVADDALPFTGYRQVLAEVVRQADPAPGMSVLDLGVGTGNLAALFAPLGCDLWCTDFSTAMLARAAAKLPSARFFRHDLRRPFPPALRRRFDRIVSAYVFHHFELSEKTQIIRRLVHDHLAPGACLVIADVAFPTAEALDACRAAAGAAWEDEPYWIAAKGMHALEGDGMRVQYVQVSECAGVFKCEEARSRR